MGVLRSPVTSLGSELKLWTGPLASGSATDFALLLNMTKLNSRSAQIESRFLSMRNLITVGTAFEMQEREISLSSTYA